MNSQLADPSCVYLDHAAATPVRDHVADAHAELVNEFFYNPHSAHAYSEKCLAAINKAGSDLLDLLGIEAEECELTWTSGGTEANNLAIVGCLRDLPGKHPVMVEQTAHSSVLSPANALEDEGYPCFSLPVDKNGKVDLQSLESSLPAGEKGGLLAVCHVNNETGCVQNLEEIRDWMDTCMPDAYLCVDALQSLGKIEIPWDHARIDYLTLGGRKIGGPAASGLLIRRPGTPLKPLMFGGGQQRGLRPGTMDTVSIVEFVQAAKAAGAEKTEEFIRIKALNRGLRQKLMEIPELTPVIISPEDASPYILNFSFPGYRSAILMRLLSEENIIVATGSACSAKAEGASHVLESMGIDRKTADGALRVSFGWTTTAADIERLVGEIISVIQEY
ncbi:MAG: cysteine desulfurase family protein [Verrucomicrobiota bacterium]